MKLPPSLDNLIEQFQSLPGIGPKSAARLTFYLLTLPDEEVKGLGLAVSDLKKNLKFCSICSNIAETDPCPVCQDETRDQSQVCIVEEPLDVISLEKSGYNGLYHVLGGVISPINGIGPEQLNIEPFLERLKKNAHKIKEVILATDPSLEGEATAMYINQQIAKLKQGNPELKTLIVTRIARGLPVGGDLEYADEMTLSRAMEGRKEY
jgi:recombination protein RecR